MSEIKDSIDPCECSVCHKKFVSAKGVAIHKKVHKNEELIKRLEELEGTKEDKDKKEKEKEKQKDDIYLKIPSDRFDYFNSLCINSIKHKTACRNRARERKGVINGRVKDEEDPLCLKEFIVELNDIKN